ncbi:MAG: GCN5-related N-acetyltransferase [Caulobacteraceae bacterium]|nr:GCN5-related N-acetyltransferase [Caulobacteraceae bacterium]
MDLSRPGLVGGDHNRELKHLMLRHAFRFVERVVFKVGETNGRSRQALEKIGARLIEGRKAEPGFGVTYLVYAVERESAPTWGVEVSTTAPQAG